jgi:hypothetical protein
VDAVVVSGKKKVLMWLLLCTLSVGFRVPVLTVDAGADAVSASFSCLVPTMVLTV